jgi:hypothetical protein
MKEIGARRVTPTLRPEDRDMRLFPWIDPENFNPGYLMRGMHLLPKRGDKPEWQHTQDTGPRKTRSRPPTSTTPSSSMSESLKREGNPCASTER